MSNALDVTNYLELTPWLATAGQPSEAQFAALSSHGFASVINLGLAGTDYALADERGSAERLGLDYVHVPVDFAAPTVDDFLAFERALRDRQGGRTLVHCAKNFRATCFTSLFLERNASWSSEQADALMRRFWEPNEVWSAFVRDVRAASNAR